MAIVAVAVIALTMAYHQSPRNLPLVSLPQPNGYDDFIAAQKLLVSSSNDPWRSDTNLTLARAEKFVRSNGPALARLRVGLTNHWMVPLGGATNWISDHIAHDLVGAKQFAQRFSLQGYVAEQNGRFGDAADAYASGIHFGAASAHGGLVIDWLVAVAVENLQFGPLEGITDKLDANQCRRAILELQAAATNYESFSTIVTRDKHFSWYYSRGSMGWPRALLFYLREMIEVKSLNPTAATLLRAKQKYDPSLLRLQRLEVTLARRAFELEHHAQAKGWSDLVPTYLPGVLTNSETGQALTNLFSE